eukprot:gene21417-1201_t
MTSRRGQSITELSHKNPNDCGIESKDPKRRNKLTAQQRLNDMDEAYRKWYPIFIAEKLEDLKKTLGVEIKRTPYGYYKDRKDNPTPHQSLVDKYDNDVTKWETAQKWKELALSMPSPKGLPARNFTKDRQGPDNVAKIFSFTEAMKTEYAGWLLGKIKG